ncbi:heterocyst frequency control protein PatD [Pantanalinema rosaneae CENA516]|uniref:heterocyst frequency control protein PatD n=1 Tax=Pantanalinema rosaneae TaxID=1620701 RepID=UPI003D6F8663
MANTPLKRFTEFDNLLLWLERTMGMLPLSHQSVYQALQKRVELVQTILTHSPIEIDSLKSATSELQTWFQTAVLPQSIADLDPQFAQRLQAIQVEIDKQLRLLGMDVMFLQAARQTATVAQRQQQIRDRLNLLSRYCDAVLGAA